MALVQFLVKPLQQIPCMGFFRHGDQAGIDMDREQILPGLQAARHFHPAGIEDILVGRDFLAIQYNLCAQIERLEMKPGATGQRLLRCLEKAAVAPDTILHPAAILRLAVDVEIGNEPGAPQIKMDLPRDGGLDIAGVIRLESFRIVGAAPLTIAPTQFPGAVQA